jgi:EVE domain-containing protein
MRLNDVVNRYWILVASKNHVLRAIQEGVAQACHGKSQPLRRMKIGDGIIYYSPKLEFEKNVPCQEFTAIGFVVGEEMYSHDMGDGFIPFRRDINYLSGVPVKIELLKENLKFITDKKRWGYRFRFGAFEISKDDFELIATAMQVSLQKERKRLT